MGYLFHDYSLENKTFMNISFQIMILDFKITATIFISSGCKMFLKM